ncbi:MAG: nitroreductase family deazaflavin-dependent oxidoreductase [Chloroflexi bacterium]|nr:nitroreductase family deazaflavin-dependent oxidoreductase [Chloroflexota bacterium]MBV9598096.1 nitroreductase family deazaflavin-dependent oxidoreductase [Chloroflexota bacterium]
MQSSTTSSSGGAVRYVQADWLSAHIFNPLVRTFTGWGISLYGSRILAVRGRASGQVRTTVVNPLDHAGARYLVAPRGTTQWVRNLRVSQTAELRLGRHRETVHATELADADKIQVLRAYLRRWRWEVGQFFQGVGPDAPDSELARIAPEYPVFRLAPPGSPRAAR